MQLGRSNASLELLFIGLHLRPLEFQQWHTGELSLDVRQN